MPQDLPPQTVTITNTKQSGGTNIGIQNNIGQQPRKFSEAQKQEFIKSLKPFEGLDNNHILVYASNLDGESANFSKSLLEIFQAAKLNPGIAWTSMIAGDGPLTGVFLEVRDKDNPPPFCLVMIKELAAAKISFLVKTNPAIHDPVPDMVMVRILTNPVAP